MPPFAGSHPTRTDSNIVTIDVGGQMFQTTKQTLTSAGPKTFFSSISQTSSLFTPFIDRDPEIFSLLLSLLRTGNLPSKAKSFDLQDLIIESQFYGIENLLINSLSNPEQLEPFNLQKSIQLPLNGRDSPSTVATTPYGSLHVAHGSKITTFDWSLRRKSTVLTHFTAVDSLLALSPSLAAAGANDFSGLQILDLENGYVKDTLNWENVTKSGSTVQAIGSSPEQMFVSFESSRRNSNSIVVYDLHSLRPVTEIAHNEIYGADIDSAIPATKLQWIESHNLLMASGSHSGPSGVSGNIRLWDVRSGNVVWEISEKVDCFADVAVSDSLNAMFKIGVNSGETFYMDMKNLGAEKNSWVCLGDKRKVLNGKKEGFGCKIETQGNQVFCTKGGDVELWSEIIMGSSNNRIFKKNLMGRVQDMGGAKITNLAFGGSRMFLTRKDLQCVEVWQSSSREL
ncbi:BTB/POZ domain-containing protein [Trifolium pratense]|uniref:BTB/POZ domain-containing protein n=1 Tax=Trifolium pratense TaxID=57577 RepID=A0A2K3MXS3_TRIPR|nr:BTB/POZ domain-containing protein At5g41330 [Trifolium pratense]PNX95608.1 BTB/POZ domain-containing protein [Trifolium pratense]